MMQRFTWSMFLLLCLLFFLSTHTSQSKLAHASKPHLYLIAGCTGAGKSTLGVSLAHSLGISRIISTDSIRSILRSVPTTDSFSAALHRSSYAGEVDAVTQWSECCEVLYPAILSLTKDALYRGTSLIIEGVHLQPTSSQALVDLWQQDGGSAVGCLLTIPDEQTHLTLLTQRSITTHSRTGGSQLQAFSRIRTIQNEMKKQADASHWIILKQQLDSHPQELVNKIIENTH